MEKQLAALCAKHNVQLSISGQCVTVHGLLNGEMYLDALPNTQGLADNLQQAEASLRRVTGDWEAFMLRNTDGKVRRYGDPRLTVLPAFEGLCLLYNSSRPVQVWYMVNSLLLHPVVID